MHASIRLIGRFASVGLAAVLLIVTGLALWVALATHARSAEVQRSATFNDLYQQARYAVGAEESLERKYRLEHNPDVLTAHREAAHSLFNLLEQARRIADSADEVVLTQVLAATRPPSTRST